jgi:hypothetical protein
MKRDNNNNNRKKPKHDDMDMPSPESIEPTLGQLVPAQGGHHFKSKTLHYIRNLLSKEVSNTNPIMLYVPSTNKLKIGAAKTSLEQLLKELLGEKIYSTWKIDARGVECESGVPEQPVGMAITERGARTRLDNLSRSVSVHPEFPCFLISMENGLMSEPSAVWKNKEVFVTLENKCFIDRTVVYMQFAYMARTTEALFVSEGVTTPLEEVKLSLTSNCTKTAGSFIGKKYNVDPKDWHMFMCGKNRESIMTDAIKSCLGLPLSLTPVAVPQTIDNNNSIHKKENIYNKYQRSSVEFFVSKKVKKILSVEKSIKRKDSVKNKDLEKADVLREYYSMIPQSSKPGADEKSPANSLGPVLTEDLMVLYFDFVNSQVVVKCVLVWAKQDDEYKDYGWVLPGRRDRAYATKEADISVEDANLHLLEKVLNVPPTQVYHHDVIGFFDDRVREQRMRSSGFVSVVVLQEPPVFDESRMIAVPLSVLKQLVDHKVRIVNPFHFTPEAFGLVRNHDSFLKAVFETPKFLTLLEKLKTVQSKYNDPKAKLPPFPEFEPGHECVVCAALMVESKIVCSAGHSLCFTCADSIQKSSKKCPTCRAPFLNPLIKNRTLDLIVKIQNPLEYDAILQQLGKKEDKEWDEDSLFNGSKVSFK